jgi:hypothetical protein
MLFYSSRALKALTYFFRPYNDIDVYIEDSLCRNMYETIINRILERRAKVTRIFQLGGRQAVLDECRSQQRQYRRNSLFIIDGDYDILLDTAAPRLEGLYRLGVYCAENLLLCETAATELAYDNMPNAPRHYVASHIAFPQWLSHPERCLVNLFIVYALAKVLAPDIQTSAYHVYQLCIQSGGQPEIDLQKVRARRNSVMRELEQHASRQNIAERLRSIRQSVRNRSLHSIHVVSGKTYLLPLLHAHLRRRTKYRGDIDTLKVQLARYCVLDIDRGLCEAILNVANN